MRHEREGNGTARKAALLTRSCSYSKRTISPVDAMRPIGQEYISATAAWSAIDIQG
jgi:hypothetical protein